MPTNNDDEQQRTPEQTPHPGTWSGPAHAAIHADSRAVDTPLNRTGLVRPLTDFDIDELEPPSGTVYAICDPDDPAEVRYIGQTTRPLDMRIREHLVNPSRKLAAWLSELDGRLVVKTLHHDVPGGDLDRVERDAIHDHLRQGHDLLNTAIGSTGQRIQFERNLARAGISAADLDYMRAHPSRYVLKQRLKQAMRAAVLKQLTIQRDDMPPEERREVMRSLVRARHSTSRTSRSGRSLQRASPEHPPGHVNAAGDFIAEGEFDPYEGCDPDEDPALWST